MIRRPGSSPLVVAACAALLTLAAAGCSSGDSRARHSSSSLRDATATDGGDRACRVVLRTIARPPAPTGGGPLTNCTDGGCWFVWEGTLDVSASAIAAGAVPSVTYQTTSVAPTWYTVPATPVDGGRAGMQRYSFRIDNHTVTDGESLTSLERTVINVEPLLTMPDKSRLFDHNRNAGDFDNYVLVMANEWAIGDDASICAPPSSSTLRFLGNWTQVQEGAIVAGGNVTVDYNAARLNECAASTYQGEPAWGISGFARFSPSGQVVSGPLTQYAVASDGSSYVASAPWTLAVPKDATGVELWFETSGETCSPYWDSDYGRNYPFAVAATPTGAGILWTGNWRSMVSRGCMDSDWITGVAEPLVLDSWALTRAGCIFASAEIWAPGLTDGSSDHPELVAAQVQLQRDGGATETQWLDFTGRVGNNYRFQWDIRRSTDLINVPWDTLTYQLRFSTNGNDWFTAGRDGGGPRTIARGADFCPSSWGSRCP